MEEAGLRNMVVLGESRDHGVEGDDVALGHGGEDGEGLIDLAGFRELSGFLVGEKYSHSTQRSQFYSYGY